MGHDIALVVLMTAITFGSRLLPFLLFGRGKQPPGWVVYLGKYLPPAMIALLVVYCVRDITFVSLGGWLPYLAAGAAVVLLQWKTKNDLVSIFTGTALYMVLVQGVFHG